MITEEESNILRELAKCWGDKVASLGNRGIYTANITHGKKQTRFLYSVGTEERPAERCPVCYYTAFYEAETTPRAFFLPSVVGLFGWRDLEHYRRTTNGHSGKLWVSLPTLRRAIESRKKGEFRHKSRLKLRPISKRT